MIHSWPLLQGISDAVCPVRCSCLLSQPTPFCFFSCEMCGKVKRNLAESAPGGATPLSCCLFLYFLFPSPRTFISFYLVVITEERYPTYAHVLTKEWFTLWIIKLQTSCCIAQTATWYSGLGGILPIKEKLGVVVHACFVWFRLQISKAFLLEPQRCSAAGILLAHHAHIELPLPSHLMGWGEPHACACIGDTSLASHLHEALLPFCFWWRPRIGCQGIAGESVASYGWVNQKQKASQGSWRAAVCSHCPHLLFAQGRKKDHSGEICVPASAEKLICTCCKTHFFFKRIKEEKKSPE